jgi:hypothetical protein
LRKDDWLYLPLLIWLSLLRLYTLVGFKIAVVYEKNRFIAYVF